MTATTNTWPRSSSALTALIWHLARYSPGSPTAKFVAEPGPAPAWYHQLTGDITLSLRELDSVPDNVLAATLSPLTVYNLSIFASQRRGSNGSRTSARSRCRVDVPSCEPGCRSRGES